MKHWIIYAFEVETGPEFDLLSEAEKSEEIHNQPMEWDEGQFLTTISEDDHDKVLQIGASSERPGTLDWDYEGF